MHLPPMDFGGPRLTVERLVEYAETHEVMPLLRS